MSSLELVHQKTDIITTCGDVIYKLADFIDKCIQEQTFVGVGLYDEKGSFYAKIGSEMNDIHNTWYGDLFYEGNGDYYTMYDFTEQYPEYEDKRYEQLVAWLKYLADKDLIPTVL